MTLLERIAKERPVGTPQNLEINEYIGAFLTECGYEVQKLPFLCKVWKKAESFLQIEENKIPIQVSPFSESFKGTRTACVVKNLTELEQSECEDRILILTEELTQESLQPKDFPFYYPDEHKAIIDCLESKKPCAIIAVTGQTCMSGLSPFPLMEDGNFHIPIANIGKEDYAKIAKEILNHKIMLSIISENQDASAYQLIASKKVRNSKGKIVICAHMDSKHNTMAALDNASGVATMLEAAQKLQVSHYDIDIVPFNSEEYFEPQGELLYLEALRKNNDKVDLLINIDTVAHTGSKVAVTTFNFEETEQRKIEKTIQICENVVSGQPWYAGDHAAFVFGGTKCILISASDLFEECLLYTHCLKDTIDLVDERLIENASDFISHVICG